MSVSAAACKGALEGEVALIADYRGETDKLNCTQDLKTGLRLTCHAEGAEE